MTRKRVVQMHNRLRVDLSNDLENKLSESLDRMTRGISKGVQVTKAITQLRRSRQQAIPLPASTNPEQEESEDDTED